MARAVGGRDARALGERQDRAEPRELVAFDDGGAVVERRALLEDGFDELPGHAAAQRDAGRHQLVDRVLADDCEQGAAPRSGERPRRPADRRRHRQIPCLARTPEHVEAHQAAADLGLEHDEQREQRDDRRGVEHPSGDEQAKLARDERANAQREDADREPECPRLAAPSQEQVDRQREDDEIDDALPVQCGHRPLSAPRREWPDSGRVPGGTRSASARSASRWDR